tara:strand:- start:1003 stop:2136 length:1134 start_codon:yes stop_codon:yes gene_type:complete
MYLTFNDLPFYMEKTWCGLLNIYNPYSDPWDIKITKSVPDFDGQAYKMYPEHNYVYDKLWVCKTQGIKGGTLEDLIQNRYKVDKYPIFIKPRWGHKSASSKNCYKIKNYEELERYKKIPHMMWSEFIDDTEGMTDFIVHNGTIVHQITYKYSKTQHGVVADDWKYISPENQPPEEMIKWINNHMKGYTGICNVQYRGKIIIEVGLRCARGGAYILNTKNKELIKSINDLCDYGTWDYNNTKNFNFTPYYSFKCFTSTPIIYLYPQHLLDYTMNANNCLEFYEYYFEPSGKDGMVFLQFLHEDFETGTNIKSAIEHIFSFTQILFFLLFIVILIIFALNLKNRIKILIAILLLFSTRFINAISTNYSLLKTQHLVLSG